MLITQSQGSELETPGGVRVHAETWTPPSTGSSGLFARVFISVHALGKKKKTGLVVRCLAEGLSAAAPVAPPQHCVHM